MQGLLPGHVWSECTVWYAGPPAAGGPKDQNASGNLSEHLACIETRLCLIADPKQFRKELLLLGGMQLLGLGGPWRPLGPWRLRLEATAILQVLVFVRISL